MDKLAIGSLAGLAGIALGAGGFAVISRQLSEACNTDLSAFIAAMLAIRQQYVTNYDPRMSLTATPVTIDNDDVIPFGMGPTPPTPGFSAPIVLAGTPNGTYAMTFRLRSLARLAGIIATPPLAVNIENRIVQAAAVVQASSEYVGLTHPGGTFIINGSADPFTFIVDTTQPGFSPTNQFCLPLFAAGKYNMLVDWGDGSRSLVTSGTDSTRQHTYVGGGFITIKVYGRCDGWSFRAFNTAEGSSDALKMSEVRHWGDLNMTDEGGAFLGCANLLITLCDDAPDLSRMTTTDSMFENCTALTVIDSSNLWDMSTITHTNRMFKDTPVLNVDMTVWNMSNVINYFKMFVGSGFNNASLLGWDTSGATEGFGYMFDGTTNFNQPIGAWDVSNCNSFAGMFARSMAFNQPLAEWDMSAATNLSQMFLTASAFNQPVAAWDVSNVTSMADMFQSATAFNQSLAGWGTGSVTTMSQMFRSATAFKQAGTLANWDITSVTVMTNMFFSTDMNNPNSVANSTNYDTLLIGWAAQVVQTGVTFHAGSAKYTVATSGAARTTLDITKAWTITDGGTWP